jgi:hypothetical protein
MAYAIVGAGASARGETQAGAWTKAVRKAGGLRFQDRWQDVEKCHQFGNFSNHWPT